MPVRANDSYLKNVPNSDNFAEKVARFRQKGFHADPVNGNDLDTVATYPILPPWGLGVPTWVTDATANDSDKTYTVPEGKVWDIKMILSQLNATAVAGNRFLGIYINNPAGAAIIVPTTTAAIAANVVGGARMYFGSPFASNTTVYNRLDTPLTNVTVAKTLGEATTLLTAGCTVRVWDVSAIDPAADDLTVVLHYIEYDA